MPTLFRMKNGTPRPFEGPKRPTELAREIVCQCGHADRLAFVVEDTHRTAFCVSCRRYVKHLGLQELPAAAVTQRETINEAPLPYFFVLLERRPNGKGHTCHVAGVFDRLGDMRDLRASLVMAECARVACGRATGATHQEDYIDLPGGRK